MASDPPLRIPEVPFDPERTITTLAAHAVEYVLIGGLAGTLHGSPLATVDADITPKWSAENLQALADALRGLGAQLCVPGLDVGVPMELAPEWFQSMTTITFVTTAGMLDVAFQPDGQPRGYDDLVGGAVTIEVFGHPVRVAALQDIIDSKRAAGRAKDRHALPYLEELRRQSLEDESG